VGKGQRLREEKRLEREQEKQREEVMARAFEMKENGEVFSCSKNLAHTEECDGNCGVEKLSDTELEINKEMERWHELGMVPYGLPVTLNGRGIGGIPVEVFRMDVNNAVIVDILVEKGIATKDELNVKFRELLLGKLVEIREANQDQIKAQNARNRIAVPGAGGPAEIIVPGQYREKLH
jgi:hypothetical protein